MVKPTSQRAPRVLGIDPGTRVVGYGVLDVLGFRRWTYVECGVLKASGTDVTARVFELAQAVEELLSEFRPDALAIESAFHGKNSSSALKLAEARGAYKLLASQRAIPLSEYAPSRVKRAVVGSGAGTKAEIQARVRLLCGLEQLPACDAADALAIAICHVQSSRAAVAGAKRVSV